MFKRMLCSAFVPSRATIKAALVFFAVVFINEALAAGMGVFGYFGTQKVASSIHRELGPLKWLLAREFAWMLLLVMTLFFLVGLAWASISLPAFRVFKARCSRLSNGGLLFWTLNGTTFLNLYYFIHNWHFPFSRQRNSILGYLFGTVWERKSVLIPETAWLFFITIPFLFLLLKWAFQESKPLRFALPAWAAAIIILFSGYSHLTGPGKPRPFTVSNNVVVFGLDSYQLNRMSIGSRWAKNSPVVDAFLRKCLLYENGWTPIARTYASYMCLLTGREPAKNGARFNLMPDSLINPTNQYLPELFRQRGYTTCWALDEVRFCNIREKHGFDRVFVPRMGIEDFLVTSVFDFSISNMLRQFNLGHDLFPVLKNNRSSNSYNPSIWVRNFKKVLNDLPRDRPAFVAVHLCGNHWPFTTPREYIGPDRTRVEDTMAMVDDQAKEILDYMEKSGLLERSTLAMICDHGDGCDGDPWDDYNDHGSDFERAWSNKIFAGFYGKGIAPGRSTQMFTMMDLYPTLLQMADIEVPGEIDGKGLLPLAAGAPAASERPFFAETELSESKVFSVREIIDEHIDYYDFDHETRLVSLRPETLDRIILWKQYMMIKGNHRVVIHPEREKFHIYPFDPAKGLDRRGKAKATDAEKRGWIAEIADHFGLDKSALVQMAEKRRFLRPSPAETVHEADGGDRPADNAGGAAE